MDTELPKGSDVWPNKTLVPIDEAWALVVELYDRFGDTPYHLKVVPDLLMDAFSALDDHHAQKSAFIVKSVNNHDPMVNALRAALVALENAEPVMKHYPEPNMRHIKALEDVRAALAAVEVQP